MLDLTQYVSRYLRPPTNAFWNWSKDGEAIVWAEENLTIAFRSEIEVILRRHLSKGLPPLGSVLLLVAACRDSWADAQKRLKGKSTHTALMTEEFRWLDRIQGLPPELRLETAAKAELSAMIFETVSDRTSPEVAAAVLDVLSNGLGAGRIRRKTPAPPNARELLNDLKPMREGLARFDVEAFQLRIPTGLEQMIEPAEEADEPLATRVRKLFNRLERDEEFSGVVRMARNLMSLVHLPRPLVQPDEIPVGGLSDIANRGTLDRLLLSELAQDDEMLMMRVAMNEAMYLRRETPPRNPPRVRTVVLDAGLRMWGIPRVMATSVAMSFAAMTHGPVDFRVFRSEAGRLVTADLSTRAGLVEHLGALDVHAHPGMALANLKNQLQDNQENDVILVTCDSVLADREFQVWLKDFGEDIEFLVTVSRGGEFQLFQRSRHGARLLRKAQFDIEVLFSPAQKPVLPLIDPNASPDLPAILRVKPFPLRLSHNIIPQQTWRVQHGGVLAITNDRRLMHWDHPKLGARQIIDRLSSRRLLWRQSRADQGRTRFIVGNTSKPALELGIVDLDRGQCELLPLEARRLHVYGICDHGGVLFMIHRHEIAVCDLSTGERLHLMTTPKGFSWTHGRYFRRGNEWKALAYAGTEPRFEGVKMDPNVQIAVFDVEGVEGPVGFGSMNWRHYGLMIGGHFLDVFPPGPGGELLALNPPISLAWSSADGRKIIIRHRFRSQGDAWEYVLIDVVQQTVKRYVGGGLNTLADSEVHLYAQPRTHRNRIRAIGAHNGQLLLQTPDLSFLKLSCEPGGDRFRIKHIFMHPDRLKSCRSFKPIPSPPGVGYRLQMAEWSDGSRAFLDSRGLLHLKSSDPKVPELTFVLSDDNVAGWCANGTMWGDDYYTDKKPDRAQTEIARYILSEFIPRLR